MTSAVCRLKALRGKPKAKHIKSELLSAVVRTHHPRVVEAQLGERGRNTDFTGWPSTEGQTGSQHAMEGKTMSQQVADAVAKKTNASTYGVAITVQRSVEGSFYVIWKQTNSGMKSHKLLIELTDEARLEAHARGFIEQMIQMTAYASAVGA